MINFAAESHVDRSIADADPFLKSNIRGTYTILDDNQESEKTFCAVYLLMRSFGSIENGSSC